MYRRRVRVLTAVFTAALAAVAAQLFRLQIVRGAAYRELAREGRVWDEITPTPRGRILDARGRVLACDRPDYGVAVVASEFPLQSVDVGDLREMREVLSREELSPQRDALRARLATGEPAVATLAGLAGKDVGSVARGLLSALERAARYDTARVPEPVLFDLDRDRWMRLELLLSPPAGNARGAFAGPTAPARRGRRRPFDADAPVPGLRCVFRARRAYPAGTSACHLTGYVGEYGAAEAATLRSQSRIVAGAGKRLRDLRNATRRAEGRAALERALGRDALERILSPGVGEDGPGPHDRAAEASSLLRRPGVVEELSAVLGPAWTPLGEWIGRPDLVALTEGELVWVRSRGHLSDRRVGRSGLERAYNQHIRGRHGYRVMIRNLTMEDGEPVPELDYLREERPRPGSDLRIEIDLSFQLAVEAVLDSTGLPGAAAFIDPRTGAVRALASRPAFDPNVFSSGDSKAVRALLEDASRPLLDRAIQGLYPPGSIFKVIVAAAALEEGVIRHDSVFDCRHVHQVGKKRLRCMADPGHGEIEVARALTVSCNVFFYQTAERLGARSLVNWARKLGLGSRTGIDLPGESRGLIPRPEEAERASPFTLALLGIGQGPMAATPLQIAHAFATIANGGRAHAPRVAQTAGRGGERVTGILRFSERTSETIMRGMLGVAQTEGGTAYRAFQEPLAPGERSFAGEFPGVLVAGKTATAERGRGRPHAWFAGFAPADDPEIAFALVIEGGGEGGKVAAPAASRMLKAYFRLTRERQPRRHGDTESTENDN